MLARDPKSEKRPLRSLDANHCPSTKKQAYSSTHQYMQAISDVDGFHCIIDPHMDDEYKNNLKSKLLT